MECPTPVRNDGTEGDAVDRRDEYRDGITDQAIHSMVTSSARELSGTRYAQELSVITAAKDRPRDLSMLISALLAWLSLTPIDNIS